MSDTQRAQVLSEVAERIALLNEFRTDGFQDAAVRLVHEARESWRDRDGLPPPGADPMFDALVRMADMADSSPMSVRDACAAAFRAAEDATVGR